MYLAYNDKELVGYLFGEKRKSNFKIKWIGVSEKYRNQKIGLKIKIRVLSDLRVNGIKQVISQAHTEQIKNLNNKIIKRKGETPYQLTEEKSKNSAFKYRFFSKFKVLKK